MIKTIFNLLFPALRIARGLHVAAATIGAGVVGAVGSSIASSNAADAQKSAAEAANSPWSQAQPYISGEFQGTQDALNNALAMGTYSGERVAGLNPYQTQGADQTAAWAYGNGANTANQFYNTGMGLTSSGQNYGNNAQTLFNTATGTDPTQGFLSYANGLANSSMANQMVDAANLDVSRDLNQTQLPSLAVTAAGNGNTDSTRTGVAQALLQSQAQQNMLANATNIRTNLFNQGLQTAQSQYNANQTQALNANGQLGNAFGLGSSALLSGQQANGNNFDQLNAAGSLYQNQQQNVDNAAQQQFSEQQSTPLNLYGQYMNVINGKWGGQAVSSVGPSTAAGAIQGAAGGGLAGYGVASKLGGYTTGDTGGAASYNFTMPGGADYTSQAGSAVAQPAGLSAFGYGY